MNHSIYSKSVISLSSLSFRFFKKSPLQLVFLAISIILQVFLAIVVTAPSLACHPLLSHVRSEIAPVNLLSLLLLVIECTCFAAISRLLSVTSLDVSSNCSVFVAQVTWITVLDTFNIANRFSVAFFPFPMAFIPSVLIVLIWYDFLDSFFWVLWRLVSDVHLLLLHLNTCLVGSW